MKNNQKIVISQLCITVIYMKNNQNIMISQLYYQQRTSSIQTHILLWVTQFNSLSIYTCIHTHIYKDLHVVTHRWIMHASIYTYMYKCMRAFIHAYTHACICMCKFCMHKYGPSDTCSEACISLRWSLVTMMVCSHNHVNTTYIL